MYEIKSLEMWTCWWQSLIVLMYEIKSFETWTCWRQSLIVLMYEIKRICWWQSWLSWGDPVRLIGLLTNCPTDKTSAGHPCLSSSFGHHAEHGNKRLSPSPSLSAAHVVFGEFSSWFRVEPEDASAGAKKRLQIEVYGWKTGLMGGQCRESFRWGKSVSGGREKSPDLLAGAEYCVSR